MEPEHHSQFPEASEQHPVPTPYRWNPTRVADRNGFGASWACPSDHPEQIETTGRCGDTCEGSTSTPGSGDTVIFSETADPRVVRVVGLVWVL